MVGLPGVTFSRKEGTILHEVQENLRLVRETEQEIPGLVAAVVEGDGASCRSRRDRIFELESNAAALAAIILPLV